MTFIVTGGTGFLGGHVVHALQRRGDEVIAIGRDSGKCAALNRLGIRTIRCDLSDATAVHEQFRPAKVVFHIAALSSPWGMYDDFYAANVIATSNLIAAALRHRVSRFVLVSTPSVTLDDSNQIETDETMPYPRRFLSFYQATKKMAEDITNRWSAEMEVVVIRPKAIFGPGDTSLLPRLIAAAKAGRLRQIGDGSNLVDLTYVMNVVDALLLASDSKIAPGRTYNITNGEHVPLWPVIRRAVAAAGCKADFHAVPMGVAKVVAATMERIADWTKVEPQLTRYAVAMLGRTQTYSIEAARRDLGYKASVPIEDGIDATISWLSGLHPRAVRSA